MRHISWAYLLLMVFFHFLVMYGLMYVMVYKFTDVYPSLNQLYMAGIMTTSMLVLEMVFMGSMYKNRNIILGISMAITVFLFILIRNQTGINNKQFLKSMISHHSGAILMCKNAPINDPEIEQLCQKIIPAQQSEIDQMKQILKRVDEK